MLHTHTQRQISRAKGVLRAYKGHILTSANKGKLGFLAQYSHSHMSLYVIGSELKQYSELVLSLCHIFIEVTIFQ